jgi:alpha-galactosidase
VQAALTGRRDYVYQAALLDPNTAATLTTDQIVSLCDELIDAHAGLMPIA